jgi:transcription antitermination factor NusG
LELIEQKYNNQIIEELNLELTVDTERAQVAKPKKRISLKVSDVFLTSELSLLKELNKSLIKAMEEEQNLSHNLYHKIERKAIVKDYVEVQMRRKREVMNVIITSSGMYGFSASNDKMVSCLEISFDRDHEILLKEDEMSFVLLEKNKKFVSIKLEKKLFRSWKNQLKSLQRKLAKRRVKEIYKFTLAETNKGSVNYLNN